MDNEVVISVENVSKNFVLPHEKVATVKGIFTGLAKRDKSVEVQRALKDINLEIKKGEFFGIVGRNGSGKSTLLKILAGIYQPTSGEIKTNGKLVPFIELGVGFNPELTGKENVYLNGAMLGFSEKQVGAMYKDIVEFAELERFMDQKLKNYSSGMQVRLAFSMATRAKADILLVDEVLAVGDADFQRKCFSYFKKLKANNKTVIFVTHDMNAVKEYCSRAMLIDDSNIKIIGRPSDVAREYNLLFMDKASDHAKKGGGKRWGNRDVEIIDAEASTQNDKIKIKVTCKVNKNLDKLIYGLHIMSEDSSEITAVNNRMINSKDITNLKKGQKIILNWEVLNIFNDGHYKIMLTLIDDLSNTLDWYVGAASFDVIREERSTTAVLPPIKVTTKLIEK